MQYRVLPRADRDLDDIADYLADESGVELALRFLDAARETFTLLVTQPLMGRKCELRGGALRGIRMFPVREFGKILVFFRLAKGFVEIVRVLHGARELDSLFEFE